MEMIQVESSSIESIGRDEATGVMQVNFVNGSQYKYKGVPVSVFNEFLNAGKKGKYYTDNIRGKYESERL